MRVLLALLMVLPLPSLAWDVSPSPICTLSDAASPTAARLTYDGQLYTLTLTHPDGWPAADVFSIQFAPRGPFISTSRHQISGATLSVSDVGFGNVLTGLEINEAAIAILGPLQRVVDLSGAAPAIRAFRECDPAPPLS